MDTKIREIIARVLNVDAGEIKMDTVIGDLDEWDSLHHLQTIVALEKEFSIKFSQEDLAELEDVSDLVSLVREMSEK